MRFEWFLSNDVVYMPHTSCPLYVGKRNGDALDVPAEIRGSLREEVLYFWAKHVEFERFARDRGHNVETRVRELRESRKLCTLAPEPPEEDSTTWFQRHMAKE